MPLNSIPDVDTRGGRCVVYTSLAGVGPVSRCAGVAGAHFL